VLFLAFYSLALHYIQPAKNHLHTHQS